MFNKSKVRKVNDLLDVAENCLNNKDRENARKAMEESYNLIKKISGYDKTKLSVRWMEIAEKSDNLAEEIANAGLTEEQIAKKKADEKVRKDKNLKEYNENKKLIDDNPLYTKWADYFWEHRLENDEALQQKFVPLSIEHFKKLRYSTEHTDWKFPIELARHMTEESWINESLGCLKYGVDKYLYFELLCKNAMLIEYKNMFEELKLDKISNDFIWNYNAPIKIGNKLIETNLRENKLVEENLKKGFITNFYRDQPITYPIKDYLLSMTQEKYNSLSNAGKFLVTLWQEYCSTNIYKDDINNFIDRINGLDQVKHQICNVRDIKVNNNQMYDFATKYFEFVESNE